MIFVLHQDHMEELILYAAARDPLGAPPTLLRSLLLTCRGFHSMLHATSNPSLYSRLFHMKFDTAAPTRRLGANAMSPIHLTSELRARFMALKCFHRQDPHDPELAEAFLVAYVMLLEDDGKNLAHLRASGLRPLLEQFLLLRLQGGAGTSNQFPMHDEMNSLAVALFWQMTTRNDIATESVERRDSLVAVLQPFALVGFRYPFLDQSFDAQAIIGRDQTRNSISRGPTSVATREAEFRTIHYLGQDLQLSLPPISLHATLSYLVRLEMRVLVAKHLPSRADHPGPGMTRDDIDEYNQDCRTRPIPSSRSEARETELTRSQKHDADWARALSPAPSFGLTPRSSCIYVPGILTGNWQGTLLIPCLQEYKALHTGNWGPSSLQNLARWPLFFSLEEHHRYSDPVSCPSGDEWDDLSNMPLPPRSHWMPREDGIEIPDMRSSNKVLYKTFMKDYHDNAPKNIQPDAPSSRLSSDPASTGRVDVILSGNMQDRHGLAWGAYKFWGRVRLFDGLIILVREPVDASSGRARSLFVGYVLSNQNFVGKWRPYNSESAGPSEPSPYEGIWSLCKQE